MNPAGRLYTAVLTGVEAGKGNAVQGAVQEHRGENSDGELAHPDKAGRADEPDAEVGCQ